MELLAKLTLTSEGLQIEGDALAMPKGSGWFVPTLDPAALENTFRAQVKEGRWKFSPGVLDGAYGVLITAGTTSRKGSRNSAPDESASPEAC
jgi:hypothetical protein